MAKNTTQQFLDIKEVRDGIITLKNGGLRAVLMVSAINFNLKAAEEQQAIIESFKHFLNSLEFPIQILVQSRPLDPSPYLKKLEEVRNQQINELLRLHTTEYIDFIKTIIGAARIMSKNFYVIVGLEPVGPGRRKFSFFSSRREEQLRELRKRAQTISSALAGLGLSNVQLNTQELLELFYSSYNGDVSYRQKLFDVSVVETPVIRSVLEQKENKSPQAKND